MADGARPTPWQRTYLRALTGSEADRRAVLGWAPSKLERVRRACHARGWTLLGSHAITLAGQSALAVAGDAS